MKGYEIGELVHIPQAVILIDCDIVAVNDPQMTIPLRIEETDSPKVGIVAACPGLGGYVRVYCEGRLWSVKNDSLYSLSKRKIKNDKIYRSDK